MRRIATATTKNLPGSEPVGGRDSRLPDIKTMIDGIGPVILHHAETLQVGMIPREGSDNVVAISIVSLFGVAGQGGQGLLHMATREEARFIAESLLRMANVENPEDLANGVA